MRAGFNERVLPSFGFRPWPAQMGLRAVKGSGGNSLLFDPRLTSRKGH
uniref:Uncharacterized protein n=1 Tax=Anguilla anguilla TaxID=7936 RepID=A0A0E9QFA3_ANGAN